MHPVEDKTLSWSSLAKALEVTRKTLATWRTMPGAPTDTDLIKWQEWSATNRAKLIGSKELRDELRRHEIRLKKAQADREERKSIARDDVDRLLRTVAQRQRSQLYQFLETEAPPKLDGLPAAQMRPILREMADSVCDTMAALVEDFQRE